MKELSKNFDQKDWKETYKFLMKHSLKKNEATKYTQLGTEFNLMIHFEKDKKILDRNFLA